MAAHNPKPHPANFKDLADQTFGNWSVIRKIIIPVPMVFWQCVCKCGARRNISGHDLRRGNTKSCGCYKLERISTHRLTHNRIYRILQNMKQRCYNKKHKDYPDYGARGITICLAWRTSVVAFYRDMGDPPSPQHTIDRKDNDGPYSPENCRWATKKEQIANRRPIKPRKDSRWITFQGDTYTLSHWARKTGLGLHCLWARLKLGWSVERALTTPARKIRKNSAAHDSLA